jgi:hypothetical protein
MVGLTTKHNNLMIYLDHYLHPLSRPPLPDTEILDYTDYDLISEDGSHLMADPPNEKEEPPQQLQKFDLENQDEEVEVQEIDDEEEETVPPQDQEEEEHEVLDLVEDRDEEGQTRPKLIVNRELRNLGVIPRTSIPRELRNLNTSYNPIFTDKENLTLASDPGEPKTMKEALIGPDRDKWIEAIKKEIPNFMSRGVWKPVSRRKVVEEMKRKLV